MTSNDKPETGIPTPPHPLKRAERLPWQTAKSRREDPETAARIEALMNGVTYRRADIDAEFLDSPGARGPRLELDYLKPELYLRERGIVETIVVFGSTRIPEPAEAERRVERLRRAFEEEPGNESLGRRLETAERVREKSVYYTIAREFGRLVGSAGAGPADTRVTLMTGGGPGIMEAANRGARDVGAKNIGLTITLPHEQYPNPYISEDLCFSVRYFAIRKLHFLLRAKALVVFPGGFGTLDELFETLNLVQSRKIRPLPVVLVGKAHWQRVFDPEFLVAEGVIDPEDRELFWYAETAEETWNGIREWHRRAGCPLACDTEACG